MTRGNPFVRAFAICALLIVTALAVAACGSSSSSGNSSSSKNGNSSNVAASSLGTTIFGTLPPDGHAGQGRHDHAGPADRPDADLHLPDRPTAQTSRPATISFTRAVHAAVRRPDRRRAGDQLRAECGGRPAGPLQRRQDVHDPPQAGPEVVERPAVTANDVLFAIDLLKAAVKESPANWGQYVPGSSRRASPARRRRTRHGRAQAEQGLQPGLLPQQPAAGHQLQRLPAAEQGVERRLPPAARTSTTGATNPAVAKQIYDYLNKLGGQVATFGQPAVEDRRRPVQAEVASTRPTAPTC